MTLTQNGIDYICQNFGDISECCVSSGLQWEWTDIDGNTGVENGGTGAAVGTLILAQLIVKITMLSPPRGDFTYQQLRTANDGNDLTFADVDQILLNDGDPPGENQWCYIPPPPCSSYTNQTECEAHDCYWWNASCHSQDPLSCADLNNEADCLTYGCEWYDGACHSPVVCKNITTQTECEAAKCYWYDGSCHSEQQYPCDHWTNQVDCEANNCYWYDGACHSAPQKKEEIPWLLYAGIATVIVGGIAVIIKRWR